MSKQLCEDFALLALLSGYFNVSETIGRVFGYAGTDLARESVYCNNRREISRDRSRSRGIFEWRSRSGSCSRRLSAAERQLGNSEWNFSVHVAVTCSNAAHVMPNPSKLCKVRSNSLKSCKVRSNSLKLCKVRSNSLKSCQIPARPLEVM